MASSPNEFCESNFSGQIRLFPLPNLVVFPNVVQALHIFEPRYREMLADSLRDDSLIGMATLMPEWEGKYAGKPPIHSMICVGKVTNHAMLDDGCSNILLVGLRRARIVREMDSDRLYRTAEVELMNDFPGDAPSDEKTSVHERLVREFRDLMPEAAMVADQLSQIMDLNASLGVLTDVIGYSLKLPTKAKIDLLSQPNVDLRAHCLLNHIRDLSSSGPSLGPSSGHDSNGPTEGGNRRPFPPDFSDN